MFVDSMAGAWKHALSTLHTVDGGGGAPTVSPVDANPLFTLIARAAAAGLEAHPDVMSAQVAIDGTEQHPRAQIECLLNPSGNLANVADLIDSLRGQIETLLGREFTAVDIRIQHPAHQHGA